MAAVDARWDEEMTADRSDNALLSTPTEGNFYNATCNALPWMDRDSVSPGRHAVPVVYVNSLFRLAPVTEPKDLGVITALRKTLSVEDYLQPALQLLIDEGLLEEENEEGDMILIVFKTRTELQARADKLVLQLIDNAILAVLQSSWEWLDDWDAAGADHMIRWFDGLTLEMLTQREQNLRVYDELCLTIGGDGYFASTAVRYDPTGVFMSVVGKEADSPLLLTIRNYYYGVAGGAGISTQFLLSRVADFFVETRWPEPYLDNLPRGINYAHDLPRRAQWATATRQQWAAIVQDKLSVTITAKLRRCRRSSQTLWTTTRNWCARSRM